MAWLGFFGAIATSEAAVVNELGVPQDEESELVKPMIEKMEEETLAEKPQLKISGDVRFEYDHYEENVNCVRLRGRGGDFKPNNEFIVNSNLYLEYRACKTYALVKLDFENMAGPFNTIADRFRIRRAYIGYNLFDCGANRAYLELGRQGLFEKFDSDVEFGTRLDGLFAYFGGKAPWVGDYYVQGAAMVLDSLFNQYAFVVETGLTDICKCGYYAKLSYINWTHPGAIRGNAFEKKWLDGKKEALKTIRAGLDKRIAEINKSITDKKALGWTSDNPEIKNLEDELKAINESLKTRFTPNVYVGAIGGRGRTSFQTVQILVGRKIKNFWCGKTLKVYAAYLRNVDSFHFGRFRDLDGKRVVDDLGVAAGADAAAPEPEAEAEAEKPAGPAAVSARLLGRKGPKSCPPPNGCFCRRGDNKNAFYVGVQLGELKKCGDWAAKAVYGWVEAFSIMPSDNNFIGRGTAEDGNILFVRDIAAVRLVTNYQGISADIAYGISDNLTARLLYQRARHIDKSLGGPAHFEKVALKFIFAF